MPPESFNIGDDCPICGHSTDTGDHRLEVAPGRRLPFLICPSFTEFYLTAECVIFDQDGVPPKAPNPPLECDRDPRSHGGKWRRTARAGLVETNWCWRCDKRPVRLVPDPLCADQIGVCGPCGTARTTIASSR